MRHAKPEQSTISGMDVVEPFAPFLSTVGSKTAVFEAAPTQNLIGAPNVSGNYLPTTSRSRLRPVAALLWRVRMAQAQGDGLDRSATCHRYSAQFPFFRARLHHSGRRRPQSAGRLRHLRCLW